MRFGQNVLRMAWKARFAHISLKAHCFHVLSWISVPQNDFWFWNVEKCDLVSLSPAERFLDLKRWEMRFGQNVLRVAWKARFVQFSYKAYCFHVLALISVPWAIFGSGTLKNAIWPKRPPHCLKSTFSTIFIQSLLFSRIGVHLSPLSNFWIWNVEKCDLVKTSSALPEKHVFYNFHPEPTVFTYWREFKSGGASFGS